MDTKVIEVKIEYDETGMFRVLVNGVCTGLFIEEVNAIAYIGDLKELNQNNNIEIIE